MQQLNQFPAYAPHALYQHLFAFQRSIAKKLLGCRLDSGENASGRKWSRITGPTGSRCATENVGGSGFSNNIHILGGSTQIRPRQKQPPELVNERAIAS